MLAGTAGAACRVAGAETGGGVLAGTAGAACRVLARKLAAGCLQAQLVLLAG